VPTDLERYEREQADQDDHVWTADFDRLVCPYLPICDPIVNGRVVKWDAYHLTRGYSESLAGPITQFLRDNNLLTN
jgi:hypothetical protein